MPEPISTRGYPLPLCPKDPNGQHHWAEPHLPYIDVFTKAEMYLLRCTNCKAQMTSGPETGPLIVTTETKNSGQAKHDLAAKKNVQKSSKIRACQVATAERLFFQFLQASCQMVNRLLLLANHLTE
jgi:hypothetical protein